MKKKNVGHRRSVAKRAKVTQRRRLSGATRRGYVEYSANNSGGSWWLKDEDWRALERAGWKVAWATLENLYDDSGEYVYDTDGMPKLVPPGQGNSKFASLSATLNKGGRYMGALAKTAYRVGLSLREAAAEFDRVTSCTSTDAGCACCGQPHYFTEYDAGGKSVASGPNRHEECAW